MRIALFLFLTFAVFSSKSVRACSCGAYPGPICTAPIASDSNSALFVGKVTEIYPSPSLQQYMQLLGMVEPDNVPAMDVVRQKTIEIWRGIQSEAEIRHVQRTKSIDDLKPLFGVRWITPRRIRFEVTEDFHGAPLERFELFSGLGGGDCGIKVTLGESYLVRARRDEATGRWTAHLCEGTRPVSKATLDLQFLRAEKAGRPLRPAVSGRVVESLPGSLAEPSPPMPNVAVELSIEGRAFRTATDQEGRFEFSDLPHARYTLTVKHHGYRMHGMSQDYSVDLTHARCSEQDVSLRRIEGEISGKLTAVQPGPKLPWIELHPVDGGPARSTFTSLGGAFEIRDIPPGSYLLAISVKEPPTTEHGRRTPGGRVVPYPPLYYPGVSDRGLAQVIRVERGQRVELALWVLSPPFEERAIRGQIAGNTQHLQQVRAALIVESTGTKPVLTDVAANGTFTLYGLTGLAYRLLATAYDPAGKQFLKGEVSVAPHRTSSEPLLVLLDSEGAQPSDPEMFREEDIVR